MEKKVKLKVKELIENMDFELINKSKTFEDDYINSPSITRAGIELSGFKIFKDIWDVIYLGKKEFEYLNFFDIKEAALKLKNVLSLSSPLIIVTDSILSNEKYKEILLKSNNTIVKSKRTLSKFNKDFINLVLSANAPQKKIHGCLTNIFGVGTLIIGDSGVGKSEVTIELIKKGHIFIADDSVFVKKIGEDLYGSATEKTKDFIEIRGLGILSFSRTFGIERMINKTQIEVVIELVKDENKISFERLGNNNKYYELFDKKIILFQIPVASSRNLSEIIETAITKYKLNLTGFDSTQVFLDKINKK